MALQEIPGGVWSSSASLVNGIANGYSLNATNKRVALILWIEKAGDLEGVEFLPGTALAINAASEIRVSFQNVDGSGEPDGTQDQYRDMLGSSLVANFWKDSGIMSSDGSDTGTKRTVARGDLIAVVFEYETFTAADVFDARELLASSVANARALAVPNAPYGAIFDGATWAKGATGDFPTSLALRYADGTYAFLGPGVVPIETQQALTLNDGFLPDDEAGLVFKLPVEATLRGARVLMFAGPGGAVDWQVRVYNDVDTQLGETVTLPAAVWGGSTAIVGAYRILTADVNIDANRWYRATVRTLSGAVSNAYYGLVRNGINKIAHLDAYEGGREFYSTRRSNNGVWTDEQAIRPVMDLHFSHFADAPGGGGGGGGGSPGRGFFRGGVS